MEKLEPGYYALSRGGSFYPFFYIPDDMKGRGYEHSGFILENDEIKVIGFNNFLRSGKIIYTEGETLEFVVDDEERCNSLKIMFEKNPRLRKIKEDYCG